MTSREAKKKRPDRPLLFRQWLPAIILIVLGTASMGAMAIYQTRRADELSTLRELDVHLMNLNLRISEIHRRLAEDSLKGPQTDPRLVISLIDSASQYEQLASQQPILAEPELEPALRATLTQKLADVFKALRHVRSEYVEFSEISTSGHERDSLADRLHSASDDILSLSTSLRHDVLDHTESDLDRYHRLHAQIAALWLMAIAVALIGLVFMSRRSAALTGALMSSEKNFRLLYEDAPLAYQSLDSEARIHKVNQAWLDLTGYSEQEVIGKPFVSFLTQASSDVFDENFSKFLSRAEVHGSSFSLLKADGSTVVLSADGRISREPDGGSTRTHCILHDITERVKSDNAIRAERQRLLDVLEMLPGFVYLQNSDYSISFANAEFRRLFGDPGGRPCYAALRDRESPCENCTSDSDLESGSVSLNKFQRDGRSYRVSGFPFTDSDGSRLILKLGVDVTDLMEKELQLKEHKERYENLYNNALAGLFRTEVDDGKVLECNDRFAELFGFSDTRELIGRSVTEFYADQNDRDRLVLELKKHGYIHDFETRLFTLSGRTVWVLNSVRLSPDGRYIDGVMTDITDRKRTQAALQATEERMKLLAASVEQSAETVCITDSRGSIQYVNPAFEKITGYSAAEVYGKSTAMLRSGKHTNEFYRNLWDTINSGVTWSGNMQNKRKNGEIYFERRVITPVVDRDGTVTNFVAIGEDITSETVAQQKLMEADKMAAVGMLAAGVAHEFKNYLGGIIGNASFALDELEDSDDLAIAKETLNGIIEMGERANEVAMSLLSYSRARLHEYSRQDLRTVINNTVALVEKELRKRSIELVTYLEDTPDVEISAGKIQQLLMNLIINAEQAISSRGVITVALFNDKSRVRLAVGDSGPGIPEENLSRIFDPFFSTKGVWGKDGVVGTGIGLSICRNIAREHNGDLGVESVVGAGTTFTLTLPVNDRQLPMEAAEPTVSRRRRMLVFSMSNDILSHYFKEACAVGVDMLTVNSFDKITENIRSTTDVVLCDAHFTGMMELMALADVLLHRGVPYIVVNSGGRDYQLSDLYEHALVIFQDLPEFDKLKKYLCYSEEPAGPVADPAK